MGKMKRKKSYTKEFKRQAVELADSLGSTTEAARQLGIPSGCVYGWRTRSLLDENSKSVASLVPLSETEELMRLRSEIAQLRKVNHILKSAAAFFSQDHLK
jgi:transposase-like protein